MQDASVLRGVLPGFQKLAKAANAHRLTGRPIKMENHYAESSRYSRKKMGTMHTDDANY